MDSSLSDFLLSWRSGFFDEIHARFQAGEEQEDNDVTHRRVLDRLLEEREIGTDHWGEQERDALVKGWHSQTGELCSLHEEREGADQASPPHAMQLGRTLLQGWRG
jgi:hypothetical protein